MQQRVLSSLPSLLLGRGPSPPSTLPSLLSHIEIEASRLFSVERASCALLNPSSDGPLLTYPPSGSVPEGRYPCSMGLAGHVAVTGETVMVSDAARDPRLNRQRDADRGWDTRDVLAAALRDHRGGTVATIELCNKVGAQGFGPRDVDMLKWLAPLLGGVVGRQLAREKEANEEAGRREQEEKHRQHMEQQLQDLASQVRFDFNFNLNHSLASCLSCSCSVGDGLVVGCRWRVRRRRPVW